MFSPRVHRFIFLFGLIGLAAGMMFGTVPTSIPEIILFANWLFEGKFREKWQLVRYNKVFWALSSLFLLHLFGLIHTGELERGMDDIRIKIPLLLLPLVFFTSTPINKKELNILLRIFVLAVVFSTLWCLTYYYTHELSEARKASRFMSHIRLGLFINFCLGVLYYLIRHEYAVAMKLAAMGIFVYLLMVMVVLGMVTGLTLFVVLCITYFMYLIIRQKLIYKGIGFALLLALTLSGFFYIRAEWKEFKYVDGSEKNQIKQNSLSGRPYFKTDDSNLHTENGFYITYNIQYDELHLQWKKCSEKDLYGVDKKGTPVVWSVIRYLSSKGLTKDSAGLAQLTPQDIENIEKGITNYKYAEASPLRSRLKEFFWEYRDYKQGFNPSGNTLLMRLEFWKAAIYIIQRNVWVGVGTGDTQRAFNKAYYRTNTKLAHEWRLRAHNQFLEIAVAFGIPGLLIFLFSIFYPIITLKKQLNNLYWLFLIIALISFVTEDTLETQTGVSYFAYFNTLFLWLASRGETLNEKHQNL